MFAYEAINAFFLEAAFLGVLLFGRRLVPPWAHFLAALMVALGTLFSAFWILAANSWMQTPAGYEIIDGRFFPHAPLALGLNNTRDRMQQLDPASAPRTPPQPLAAVGVGYRHPDFRVLDRHTRKRTSCSDYRIKALCHTTMTASRAEHPPISKLSRFPA